MEKFNLFTNSISNILSVHEKQLNQHTKELAQVRLSMEDKTTRIQGQLDYEKERIDKKRKEDSAYLNSFINNTTQKYDTFMN